MANFDDLYHSEMSPRPKLQRGIPSPENLAWDREYLQRYFPRDGVDLMRRFRVGRSQSAKESTDG